MYFKDKRAAQLNVHQESTLNNYAVISGDKGLIEVSIHVCLEIVYSLDLPVGLSKANFQRKILFE